MATTTPKVNYLSATVSPLKSRPSSIHAVPALSRLTRTPLHGAVSQSVACLSETESNFDRQMSEWCKAHGFDANSKVHHFL